MSYGNITYTDVVNQVQKNGWQIIRQSPDETVIEKRVGAPRVAAIALALVPIVGMMAASGWIAARGKITVRIERQLMSARIHTPRNAFDVTSRDALDMFFSDYGYHNSVGYYPVLLVGGIISFGALVLLQVLM